MNIVPVNLVKPHWFTDQPKPCAQFVSIRDDEIVTITNVSGEVERFIRRWARTAEPGCHHSVHALGRLPLRITYTLDLIG